MFWLFHRGVIVCSTVCAEVEIKVFIAKLLRRTGRNVSLGSVLKEMIIQAETHAVQYERTLHGAQMEPQGLVIWPA